MLPEESSVEIHESSMQPDNKTNNNKPTKISHNFSLLSKFYAGLLIFTLHLPEP